jgi:hypothetical protein
LSFGTCENPDYLDATTNGAADIEIAAGFLSKRDDVDPGRFTGVGLSGGGFGYGGIDSGSSRTPCRWHQLRRWPQGAVGHPRLAHQASLRGGLPGGDFVRDCLLYGCMPRMTAFPVQRWRGNSGTRSSLAVERQNSS